MSEDKPHYYSSNPPGDGDIFLITFAHTECVDTLVTWRRRAKGFKEAWEKAQPRLDYNAIRQWVIKSIQCLSRNKRSRQGAEAMQEEQSPGHLHLLPSL
jgi:hypothetical protein